MITKVINDTNAESIRDMSKVMKVLKEEYGEKCDFQKASKIVKEKLSKKKLKENVRNMKEKTDLAKLIKDRINIS